MRLRHPTACNIQQQLVARNIQSAGQLATDTKASLTTSISVSISVSLTIPVVSVRMSAFIGTLLCRMTPRGLWVLVLGSSRWSWGLIQRIGGDTSLPLLDLLEVTLEG